MGSGRYEETEGGLVFIPDGEVPVGTGGFVLSFEGSGVVLRFITHRPQPSDAETLTADLVAVSPIWLPRQIFEALPAAFRAYIEEWDQRGV